MLSKNPQLYHYKLADENDSIWYSYMFTYMRTG